MNSSHLIPQHQITKANRPSLDFICTQVATQCSVTKARIIAKGRSGKVVDARAVFVQIATIYRYTAEAIGNYLSNRNYTTICHALSKFANLYNTNDANITYLTAQVQNIFPNVLIKPFRNHEYQN
jgi:chromosomal replication initiation ATPase DnaA